MPKWDSWKFYTNDVCLVTLSNFKPTDKHFEDMLERFEHLIENKERVGIIFDASNLPTVSFRQGLMVVKFLKKHHDTIKKKFFGSAVVVSSSIVKNVIQFVLKIQPPAAPNTITESFEDGMKFVREKSES